jgi:hypothetical protein
MNGINHTLNKKKKVNKGSKNIMKLHIEISIIEELLAVKPKQKR